LYIYKFLKFWFRIIKILMSDEITDENLSLRINMMISFFNDRRTRLYDKKPLKFKVVKQFNGSYLKLFIK
jgi:hypothetical protein